MDTVRVVMEERQSELEQIDFMQQPLLSGDVWIGFDHVARVLDALRQKPGEFVAFPAPSGPRGRGTCRCWPASGW